MRFLITLGEVLPVLGTLGLLGLWTFQQTGIEKRTSELRKFSAARAVYQTYQSNNALFNALIETVGKNEKAVEQIRTFQTYNYELGLQQVELALPASDRKGIPAAKSAYDGTVDTESKLQRTQVRLEKLQERLDKREASISAEAAAEKRLYLWLYIGISVLAVIGAVIKAAVKLAPGTG